MPRAADELTDCKQAFLRSHTRIKNTDPGNSQYIIQVNSTDIIFYNGEKQNTIFILSEPITTFLKSYRFQYNQKEDTLSLKKADSNACLLRVYDYSQPNSEIVFIDAEETRIVPQFIGPINPDEKEPTLFASSFLYSMQVPSRDRDIRKIARSKHNTLLENHPESQFIGHFYDLDNPSDRPKLILGARKKNMFVLDNIKQLKYVLGNDGVDIYIILKQALDLDNSKYYTLIIDNYSSSSKIDELHLPFPKNETICLRDLESLNCHSSKNPHVIFSISDYFLGKNYQHLFFVDSEQKFFIPIFEDNTVNLIPYHSNEFDSEIELDVERGSLKIAVEGELSQTFQAYRSWDKFFFN